MNNGEALLQSWEKRKSNAAQNGTGTTMQNEENGVLPIFAAHVYPLLDTPDANETLLAEGVGAGSRKEPRMTSLYQCPHGEGRESQQDDGKDCESGHALHCDSLRSPVHFARISIS